MSEAGWMSMIANHLWQSTVVVGIIWLLAFALRNNQAKTRYRLWLIASAKFLLPFSLLFAIGSHLRWTSAPMSPPAVSARVAQIARPFPAFQFSTTTFLPAQSGTGTRVSVLPILLVLIWLCGFLAVVLAWTRRWLKIRAIVRSATKMSLEIGLPVLSSASTLEPGVFGIFRPVLLLPAGITDRLSSEHLRAIIAHELCHVRRRDNLAASIHMMVEAIFWFHPLVWWIGSRLVDERERACDEEVLRLGSEREIYAESILKACQFYLESPLVCVSGITGSDLKERIVRIMTLRMAERLSIGRKFLLAIAGVAAIAGPLLFGVVNSSQNGAMSATSDAGPLPSFEVASIKLNNSGDRRVRLMTPPGRFTAENVPVRTLIEYAYNIRELQLSGGPSWIDSERYDIEAKSDLSPEEMRDRYPDDPPQALRLMLQSLLADRFKLVLNRQTKDAPIYVLTVAKGGPKFHETAVASPNSTSNLQGGVGQNGPRRMLRMGRGQITMADAPISSFAAALSGQVGRMVIDKTGLTGHYDLTLQWTPDETQGRMPGGEGGAPDGHPTPDIPAPDANGPTIFTALQEQLGLKLESQKGPVQSLVIEEIEKPSQN